MGAYKIESEGDDDALTFKLTPQFTLNDIAVLPIGSHVMMVHTDAETGRIHQIDGYKATQEWIDQVLLDHAENERDAAFSSIMFWLPPLDEDAASQIADTVIEHYAPANVPTFTHTEVRAIARAAARLGRGVDVGV